MEPLSLFGPLGDTALLLGLSATRVAVAFLLIPLFTAELIPALVRNALGLQQVPPNVVLNGLALVLSVYVMYPVGTEMAAKMQGIGDIGNSTQSMLRAADVAKEPLREFLLKHSRPIERAFFLKTAQKSLKPEQSASLTERDFLVVVPAFTVSELSVAFEIGFLIFLPFLVIDLVISNILMAMGMQMLSPTTVSMPFKLLLFVLIDGWHLLTRVLAVSFR